MKFIEKFYDLFIKLYSDNNLLDGEKLLNDALVIIERNKDEEIIPFSTHLDKISKNVIYIRYGQLNNQNEICGLGRKIHLSMKYSDNGKEFLGFDEETTYIEEG